MQIKNLLHQSCIEIDSQPGDKQKILAKIATLAKKNPLLAAFDTDSICQQLMAREQMGSTAVNNTIAFPHCRLEGIDNFVVGMLVYPDGVDFGASDNQPTKIFIFVIGPQQESNQYLHVLSSVARLANTPEFITDILDSTSNEALYEAFAAYLEQINGHGDKEDYVLFHAFFQKEQYFRDILEIFNATPDCSLQVIDAHAIAEYLSAMPLYMSFWRDQPERFNNMLVGVMPRSSINKMLWQIKQVAGDLQKQRGVMIVVQDVLLVAGGLD